MPPKTRLTITIDKDIHTKAKEICEQKNIKLSNLIENYLNFFVNPYVYCFSCGAKFETKDAKVCPKCTWLKCPKCGACGCELDEEVAKAIFQMRKVYEDLLQGRLKN
jgi:translation initiation factor 2 beta subunit (eIF-2beta)/eIF-5